MSDEFSESALVHQAIAGDRIALSQLLLIYYDDLQRHVVQQLSRDTHELLTPDDILQQTFVRAALAIGGFDPRTKGAFRAWMLTIAGNLVRDAQKRRRRERRAGNPNHRLTGDAGNSDGFPAAVDQLVGDTTSPSMRFHRRDSVQRMQDALETLPAEQRDVIQRHYLQHQSLDQIAAATQRTKDAVRGICYRARQNLRSLLGHSSWFFSN